jgi:putative PIG3 family NAD(P)H quinone oxidoreductase
MRAVIVEKYGGPEVLKIVDIPEPVAGPGQVKVRVVATALNRADILQRKGLYPRDGPKPMHEVPGLEFAGEVVGVGEGVKRFKVGDRVFGVVPGGGYAEIVVTHERLLLPVPSELALIEAAGVPEAFMTAFDALVRQAQLRPGARVLVHAGGSGVGTAAIQICKALHAEVFTTVGTEEKARRCLELGADYVINRQEEDFVEVIRRKTDGKGVDIVIELVGGPYLSRDVQVMAYGGRIVVLGLLGGSKGELPLDQILFRRLTITGSTLRRRGFEEKVVLTDEFGREIIPLLRRRILRPVIDRVYPLDEVSEAHRYMESNKNFGKIVLRIDTT